MSNNIKNLREELYHVILELKNNAFEIKKANAIINAADKILLSVREERSYIKLKEDYKEIQPIEFMESE